MDERSLFTGFWENESKTTRKVIARIRKVRLPAGSTVLQIYGPSGDEP